MSTCQCRSRQEDTELDIQFLVQEKKADFGMVCGWVGPRAGMDVAEQFRHIVHSPNVSLQVVYRFLINVVSPSCVGKSCECVRSDGDVGAYLGGPVAGKLKSNVFGSNKVRQN